MLAFGMVGDEFGRKKVMLTGAGVFCASSVLCALAPNTGTLIAGRAVMGLGAAASEPGTLSMLRHLYRDEHARNRAIGVWAGVSGLALAVGPVVGGAIVGLWNWRGIFWFNLVFGLATLIAAAGERGSRCSSRRHPGRYPRCRGPGGADLRDHDR
jgi:MFS family permease